MAGSGNRSTGSGRGAGAKVSAEQRAIATAMKKAVRSKNVQATRILQKMAAKDGHGGSVKSLTTGGRMASNRWIPNPLNRQRGNEMSAERGRDLAYDRGPSRRLIRAAVEAVAAGRVSNRRLDLVLQASGNDYMTLNQGYEKAVARARTQQQQRRARA